MITYEIYSERGCKKQFELMIQGEAKAEAWVKEFLENNPEAHAWCAPMCEHDDPAFM